MGVRIYTILLLTKGSPYRQVPGVGRWD